MVLMLNDMLGLSLRVNYVHFVTLFTRVVSLLIIGDHGSPRSNCHDFSVKIVECFSVASFQFRVVLRHWLPPKDRWPSPARYLAHRENEIKSYPFHGYKCESERRSELCSPDSLSGSITVTLLTNPKTSGV